MPLWHRNTRVFHWILYGQLLETITYRAYRTAGQPGATAVATDYTVNRVRRKKYDGTGEVLTDPITGGDQMTFQVGQEDLDRAGVPSPPQINDEITTSEGERWLVLYWRKQMTRNIQNIFCRRTD